jgi:hypothetical protein
MEVTDVKSTENPEHFVLGWKKIDSDAPERIRSWLETTPKMWAFFVHVGETGRVMTVHQYLGK